MATNLRPWKNGLCDCCAGGAGICLLGCMCSPCLLASARNDYDSSNWCFNLLCMMHPATRNVIREGYEIEGDCVGDIFFGMCCIPCSACQIANEVAATGHIDGKK